MTAAQKIHMLRQFEGILNMLDEQNALPFGIVVIHETDNELMGFSPMFAGDKQPLENRHYGYLLSCIGHDMMTNPPSSEHQAIIGGKTGNQNLN